MTTKKDLLKQQEVLEKELEKLRKQIKDLPDKIKERWFPDEKDEFYFINHLGYIDKGVNMNTIFRKRCYHIGNVYKTEKDAQEYLDNLIVKQRLNDLALELNNGEEIDWTDCNQPKYCIDYSYRMEEFKQNKVYNEKYMSQSFCLNKNFLKKAKEKIGEDNLIKLIKSGV